MDFLYLITLIWNKWKKLLTKIPILAQHGTFLKGFPGAQAPHGNGWGLHWDCTEAWFFPLPKTTFPSLPQVLTPVKHPACQTVPGQVLQPWEPNTWPLSKITERVNSRRARILILYLWTIKPIWKIFTPNYDQLKIMLPLKLFELILWSENYPKGLFLRNNQINVCSWCLSISWDDEKTAIQSVIGLTRLSQISEQVAWIIHGTA